MELYWIFLLIAASWEVEEAYSIFWWIVISKVGSMLISASWLPFARVCHFFPFLAICKSKSTVWELMFCLCCLSHWWCAGAWFLEELWKRAVFCSFAPLCSHYYTGDCFLQQLRWLFCSGLWLSNQWSVAASNPQASQGKATAFRLFTFPFLQSLAQNKQQTMKQAKLSNFPCLHLFHLMRMVSGHKPDIATDIDTGLSVADGKQESWLWSGFFYLTEQHYSM